jgi:hypothetical protein
MSTCCRCGVVLDPDETPPVCCDCRPGYEQARPSSALAAVIDANPIRITEPSEPISDELLEAIWSNDLPKIDHHSPEKIVEILHSITKLELNEVGELETWFDSSYPEVARSFVLGSFTRELLELIESHLK